MIFKSEWPINSNLSSRGYYLTYPYRVTDVGIDPATFKLSDYYVGIIPPDVSYSAGSAASRSSYSQSGTGITYDSGTQCLVTGTVGTWYTNDNNRDTWFRWSATAVLLIRKI